jgi:hypothetical protein
MDSLVFTDSSRLLEGQLPPSVYGFVELFVSAIMDRACTVGATLSLDVKPGEASSTPIQPASQLRL